MKFLESFSGDGGHSAPVSSLKSMLHSFKHMDPFHDVSWVAVTVSKKAGLGSVVATSDTVLLKHCVL